MNRYRIACRNDTRKAMTLYRYNLRLSQELFTVISCFEVALRNAIDYHCIQSLGKNWLRDSIAQGGRFASGHYYTKNSITEALRELGNNYSHSKLIAKMDFGFWRYLFSRKLYRALGQNLLQIFPAKPSSTTSIHYNQTFIFNELAKINELRNRIAHHEPICFKPAYPIVDSTYARQHYNLILQLFQWMSIDEAALLYGLDHINPICDSIDLLMKTRSPTFVPINIL